MSDNKVSLKLNDYLTMDDDETISSENMFLPFVMRHNKVVYIRDEWAFRRYINELYDSNHIERYAYSKKEFRDFVINTYIKFNGDDKIEVNLAQEIDGLEIKECHVLLPIFNVHMHEAELNIGNTPFIQFQALGEYTRENNFCSPKNIDQITQDTYFADIPFLDIVVHARDSQYAYEQAQVRLDEIIHLLNFILYSNYRGVEVISSTTNSGTRERYFIVGKGWGSYQRVVILRQLNALFLRKHWILFWTKKMGINGSLRYSIKAVRTK